jgi:2-desacetyl-2-hydroxyethyl bacteriochlorophyllide A dehydrogenase
MKAILITEPPRFELTTLPDPACGPDEVVIRTAFCGICGTDIEILRGSMPEGFARYPVVPGHEWTGVIEELGSGVKGHRVGDRVSVEGYLPCGKCARCLAGSNNLCITHEQIGMTRNGGLAELVAAPARSCHTVASQVGLDEALMVEPASTVVRGVERIHPPRGCTAAVVGCGPIGLIAARVLSLYEPANVLGIDLAPTQRGMAARAGFTQFTCSQDAEELREMSRSDGWDVVVDCAGGSRPLDLSFQIVRRGGAVAIIGGSPDSDRLTIPANLFVTRDLHVEGLLGYTTDSWIKTLALVERGALPLGDLITHRRELAEFDRALELLESRNEPIGKVAIAFG